MRISRKKRPEKPLIPHYRINTAIKADEVRVIGVDGVNVGVFSVGEALRMAETEGVDLIEINPKAQPPVAQLAEFKHFKYQKEKEARKQKQKSHVSEMKGIRLSMRISDHDMQVRKKQAMKFLDQGDKVKAEVILRDRERIRPHLAFEAIEAFYNLLLEDVSVDYEQVATRQGNKVTAIIKKK